MKPAELRELDKPWRLWASVIIVSLLAFSVVFGFILPIVQAGRQDSTRSRPSAGPSASCRDRQPCNNRRARERPNPRRRSHGARS